jgi:hypothetical protein
MNPELLRYLQGLYTGGGLEPAAPEPLEPELVDPQGPMRPEVAMSGIYDPTEGINTIEKQMRSVQRARDLVQGALEAETEQLIAQGAAQPLRKLSMPEAAPPEQMGRRLPLSASPLPASPSAPAVAAAGALAPTQPEAPLPGIQQLLSGDMQPRRARGYLESLEEAQRQDDAAAAFRRLGMAGQGIAQALSQGVYRPIDLGTGPSAVAQLQQRQAAVADYLQRQRQEQEDAARLRYMGAQTKAYEALATQREREPVPKPVTEPRESLVAAEQALAEQRKAAAELARKQAEQVGKPKPGAGAGAPKAKPRDIVGEKQAEYERRLKEGIPVGYELRPGAQPTTKQREDAAKLTISGDMVGENVRDIRLLLSKPLAVEDPRTRELLAQQGQFIKTQLRVLEDLGVPSGPDAKILDTLIGDPESLKGNVLNTTMQKLDALSKYVNARVQATTFRYGLQPVAAPPTRPAAPPEPATSPTGGAMKLPPPPAGMVYVQMAKDGSVRPVAPDAARALITAGRAKEVAP